MKTATDVGLQTWEADVTCGVWCQGGSVRWLKTDHPQYTDASDVWVRGDDAIAALESLRAELAERDEARVMADKLTAELAACAAALPGVYYMDSPDGGDVPVSEQLRRMAKDAERYRLLRRKFAIISDGEGHAEFCAINLPRPTYIAPSSAIELDTALDRERLGLDGVRPPTPVGWSDADWIKHLQEQPRPVRHNQTEQEE